MAYWRNDPGHSWLILNGEETARVPAFARRPDYEEDTEWVLAVMALPGISERPEIVRRACGNNPGNGSHSLPGLVSRRIREVHRRKGDA